MYVVNLPPEIFKALSDHLADFPVLHDVWRDVEVIFGSDGQPEVMVLSCDEMQIQAMLCLARLHCPPAEPLIQKAIS